MQLLVEDRTWFPFFLTLAHTPGSICKEQYTRAMEESVLKLASVAGSILKLELANTMPPTWKVTHQQNE